MFTRISGTGDAGWSGRKGLVAGHSAIGPLLFAPRALTKARHATGSGLPGWRLENQGMESFTNQHKSESGFSRNTRDLQPRGRVLTVARFFCVQLNMRKECTKMDSS